MILVLFKILLKFSVCLVRFGPSFALEFRFLIATTVVIFELSITTELQLRVQITLYASKSGLGGKKHLSGVLIIRVEIRVIFLGLYEILFFNLTNRCSSTHSKKKVRVRRYCISGR